MELWVLYHLRRGAPLAAWPLVNISQNMSPWLIAPMILGMFFLLVVVPSTIEAVKCMHLALGTWKTHMERGLAHPVGMHESQ